ncbi:MAG: hypothetical protein DRJ09_00995 [Bacteroidetes bacterium]|nr:MAG: hypothetical protein DRJ09_00995 [Bacteroidota bacterium]
MTGKVMQQKTAGGNRRIEISGPVTPGSYLLLLKTAREVQSVKFIKQL